VRRESLNALEEWTKMEHNYLEHDTDNILNLVREGMTVYDIHDHKIGKVRNLYYGATGAGPRDTEAKGVSAPDPGYRDESIVDNVAEAFAGDLNIPDVLRNRLLNSGFVRVDTGVLHSDRYVLPEQISHISGDKVYLKTGHDELIKHG